jgi:hypothetical protein
MSEISQMEEPKPEEPQTAAKSYTIYRASSTPSVYETAVISSIRLEYLKLAVIVIIVMVIIWYLSTKMSTSHTEEHPANGPEHLEPNKQPYVPVKDDAKYQDYIYDNSEHLVPYASWLVPDIYRSDAAHDKEIHNDSHFGMFAPLNTDYLYPESASNGNRENIAVYRQPGMTSNAAAAERDVPEIQLETEAGLLFGLTNYDTTPVTNMGPL